MDVEGGAGRRVVGGVDTHKDLHVAAVVDEQDRVLGTRCFATTRQGYRQMLAWMRSFGEVQRIERSIKKLEERVARLRREEIGTPPEGEAPR